MKYSIRGGWAESTHKTPPARLGRPQRWARMSAGLRPSLAGVFLFVGSQNSRLAVTLLLMRRPTQ